MLNNFVNGNDFSTKKGSPEDSADTVKNMEGPSKIFHPPVEDDSKPSFKESLHLRPEKIMLHVPGIRTGK